MTNTGGAKKSIFKRWWFWLLIVIVVFAVAGGSGGSNNQSANTQATVSQTTLSSQNNADDSAKITMDEFQKLKNGITYSEAVNIIGGEGTLSSEIGVEGEQFHTITYTFEGDKLASSAIITFQEGKLSSKTQFGLE